MHITQCFSLSLVFHTQELGQEREARARRHVSGFSRSCLSECQPACMLGLKAARGLFIPNSRLVFRIFKQVVFTLELCKFDD